MELRHVVIAGAWSAAVFNALIAFAVLRWRLQAPGPERITIVRVLSGTTFAVAAAGACWLVQALLVVVARTGVFALILLAYLTALAVAFALGAALCWLALRPRRGPRLVAAALAFLFLAPVLIGAHASLIAPYQLKIERVTVGPPSRSGADAVRIAVLADIQTDHAGAYEHHAVELALREKPDLIVLPGDIFQGGAGDFERAYSGMRDLLARLDAPYGAYACLGNVDHPGRVTRLLRDAGVRLLNNEIVSLDIRGRRVALAGVEWNCVSPAAQGTFRRLGSQDADLRLVLCHTPDGVFVAAPADRIDLVIAGHTHGGQVVLPGLGPLLTLVNVPRAVAAGGLHVVDGKRVYVSRGVGFERGVAPPLRLFCPPELTMLTLR